MDHFQGITAEIISDGRVLKLYDDPDAAENEDNDARHHYVEAVFWVYFQCECAPDTSIQSQQNEG